MCQLITVSASAVHGTLRFRSGDESCVGTGTGLTGGVGGFKTSKGQEKTEEEGHLYPEAIPYGPHRQVTRKEWRSLSRE